MKFIHLSDLHIGKRVNEFSMLEDQKNILKQIVKIIEDERPEAVLIAGDVYDKSVPSAEAVEVFDQFLVDIARKDSKVFIISGNHDSPERLAFGGRLMKESGVYISPVYQKGIKPITLTDTFGEVDVYLLPFVKPIHVRNEFPEKEVHSYTEAVQVAIEDMEVDVTRRNILVTHQFVTGASRCDSEEISIGGSDNVEATVFEAFDYVALGHIHGPQKVVRETIRYSGTPLKYSFSECNHKKSVTMVELLEKGKVDITLMPLNPKRDLKELKGTYLELTKKSFYENRNVQDYFHITLTDEEDILDAVGKLRVIYPNIMKLDYDNTRTRKGISITETVDIEDKSPYTLFGEFYEIQNNQGFSKEQEALVKKLMEGIWEEDQ